MQSFVCCNKKIFFFFFFSFRISTYLDSVTSIIIINIMSYFMCAISPLKHIASYMKTKTRNQNH